MDNIRLPKETVYHVIPVLLFILAAIMALYDKQAAFITFTLLGVFFGISAHASRTVTYESKE